MLKTKMRILISGVLGFLLPPVLGTFACFILVFFYAKDVHPPFWSALLAPLAAPFIFIYAFVFMGPSSIIYASLMTLLGMYGQRREPVRFMRSNISLFLITGTILGLLSPLGMLLWESKSSSWSDFIRFFSLACPAGAFTGALCSLPIYALWRKSPKVGTSDRKA